MCAQVRVPCIITYYYLYYEIEVYRGYICNFTHKPPAPADIVTSIDMSYDIIYYVYNNHNIPRLNHKPRFRNRQRYYDSNEREIVGSPPAENTGVRNVHLIRVSDYLYTNSTELVLRDILF